MVRAPGFRFGVWHASERRADGVILMPWYERSDSGDALVAALAGCCLPGFNWPRWLSGPAGHRQANDPVALAGAGPADLCRLITALVRSDRFSEGSLAGAYESGLLGRVLDRVAEVVLAGDAPPA